MILWYLQIGIISVSLTCMLGIVHSRCQSTDHNPDWTYPSIAIPGITRSYFIAMTVVWQESQGKNIIMKASDFLVLSLALLVSCQNKPIYIDPSESVENRVEDLLSLMNLQEKINQVNQFVVGENTNDNNAICAYFWTFIFLYVVNKNGKNRTDAKTIRIAIYC